MLEQSRFSAAEVCRALERLSEHGEIFLSENAVAKMLVWRELRGRAAELIDADHKAHPERRGPDLNELRASFSSISAQLFDALIVDLCRDEFVRSGSTIARKSHRANLPPELKSAADKIHETLAVKPLDPPSRKDFSEDRHLQQALRFLIEQGELVELNSEIVLLRDAAEQMRTAVAQFLAEHGPATASQLRQAIGTSRRVIIPFLEYLDRTGVTQRAGDVRQLRETKSAAVARR
jgi:selenocysteine-specific elongation factor